MSLREAARAGVDPEPSPSPRPESAPDVDIGAGRRPRRTYWDDSYGGREQRSKADWLGEYARMRREMHKEMDSQDRSQDWWLVFLIGMIFAVFGGVVFVVNGVADFFRVVLTGS